MRMTRRQAMAAVGAAGAAAIGCACRGRQSGAAGACAAVSGRTIRWIVPNAPGGGYDTESRLLKRPLERRLRATIAIENRPGAGGTVGARALASAAPDGITLGMIGVPGLLLGALGGRRGVPNPATAFTVLARVSRSWQVWAAGPGSSIASAADAIAVGTKRPLIFAVSQATSPNIVSIATAAALLDVPVELVGGFQGSRNACLAAIRGDVDLVCFNYATIRSSIRSGELSPVLQISTRPIAADPVLTDVAVLGGESGIALERARARGADVEAAAALADTVERVVAGGRLVVAPSGLPAELAGCLSHAVYGVLTEDITGTTAAFDPAPAGDAAADLQRAAAGAAALLPLARPLMDSLRGRA